MSRFIVTDLAGVRLRAGGGRPPTDRRRWVIRPVDLLVLGFDLTALRVEPGEGDRPAQVMKDGTGQAYLVVWFPPQHIVERAYFTTKEPDGTTKVPFPVAIPDTGHSPPLVDPDGPTGPDPPGDEEPDPPPIDAVMAGWTRLVFRVPDDRLPIDWTLDSLLAAMGSLELSVTANALPPAAPESRLGHLVTTELTSTNLALAEVEGAVSAAAAVAQTGSGAARLVATARGRRKVRTIANALGVSAVTGSATRSMVEAVGTELVKPDITPILRRPGPAPPAASHTAIELPYHLVLSPNRFGTWFHREQPATSSETGHTELWHTRLGVRRADGTVVDGDDPLRTLRAVWALDSPWASNLPLGVPDHDSDDPWRMSLDAFDRHNIMHLSSNFGLSDGNDEDRWYEPSPLDVELLALSSLGGWLDARGSWPFRQPTGLSVEEWRHRATLGRDHYVRVVYAGFLVPFGHRASVIKITERQFHADRPGNAAYLRQRMFLVVREQVKTYRTTGLRYDGPDATRTGEQYDLMMPFEAVRILTLVSPLLDKPENDDVDNKEQGAFWPRVGGQPFKFHVSATDSDGNPVDMAMPLLFVGKEEADRPYSASIIPTAVKTAYENDTWPVVSSDLRATVSLGGQKVAFAKSAGPDDTAFSVQSLTWGTEVPAETTYEKLGPKKIRFFPVVRKAQIDVPSLQRLAKTALPAPVVFPHLYLAKGFAAADNPGQVFLAADPDPAVPKLGVAFSSQGDRSGGLVTPDMKLSGLSRITGPVSGDLATAAKGSFSPQSWFGALAGAKLFGVLALTDILDAVGFDELDKLPQFTGQSLNQVEQVLSGLSRLQQLAGTNLVAQTGAIRRASWISSSTPAPAPSPSCSAAGRRGSSPRSSPPCRRSWPRSPARCRGAVCPPARRRSSCSRRRSWRRTSARCWPNPTCSTGSPPATCCPRRSTPASTGVRSSSPSARSSRAAANPTATCCSRWRRPTRSRAYRRPSP